MTHQDQRTATPTGARRILRKYSLAVDVSFWFDPACPFCWMTSRWIKSVEPHRDLRIDWRSISLLAENDPPSDDPKRARFERTASCCEEQPGLPPEHAI